MAACRSKKKPNSRVGKLSGGQKQRLAVACALVGDPQLLFLDEPTTGLDPASRRQLWEIIRGFREHGRTILLTTHYMDEAERLCDRIAIVDHGKVIALGTPAELIASLGGEHVIEFTVEQNGAGRRDLAPSAGTTSGGELRASGERRLHACRPPSCIVALPELVGELTRQRVEAERPDDAAGHA